MYAVVLVLNHPVQNFNQNILVMTESSTCSQEMAFNQTKQLAEAAMAPLAGNSNDIKIFFSVLGLQNVPCVYVQAFFFGTYT